MENMDRRADDAVGDGFDQTNALAGDQLGESDGTSEGELTSAADRENRGGLLADDEGDTGGRGEDRPLPGNPARGGAGGL